MSNLWPILRHNQSLAHHGMAVGRRLIREVHGGPELVVKMRKRMINCKLH